MREKDRTSPCVLYGARLLLHYTIPASKPSASLVCGAGLRRSGWGRIYFVSLCVRSVSADFCLAALGAARGGRSVGDVSFSPYFLAVSPLCPR